MRRSVAIALLALTAATLAASAAAFDLRPDKAIRVATGLTAKTLCSDVFVSGLDPATVYHQAIESRAGVRRLAHRLHYRVDASGVSVTYFGHFESRAIYRPGLGCLLLEGQGSADPGPAPAGPASPSLITEIAGPTKVTPDSPGLKAALDHVFTDPANGPPRWLRAVVVMKDGRVIAERYGPGVGVATPLVGYSATKSVMSSLVGILVRQGRLDIHAPAPVPTWAADDPRHAITLDNLLRMTSGLDIAQTGSGFDPASRMLYTERDMAGFAEAHRLARPVGSRWDYSDASTLIVSRIVRDAAGGNAAGVLNFARRELFDPLGMTSATLEVDATGTPVGSTAMLATARDWARLGYLYAHDGVVGGRRILPEGWVDYSATPTLGSAYGAGFWTNRGPSPQATARIRAGMPCDALFASGVLGQRVYVIPSSDLVIVRFGITQKEPDYDIAGDMRLVREVLASLPHSPPAGLRPGLIRRPRSIRRQGV